MRGQGGAALRKLGQALAAFGLAVSLALGRPAGAAQAATPAFAAPSTNPFGLSGAGILSKPAFADLDGDGDLDLLVGESLGNLLYYRNSGSAINPLFAAPSTNWFGLTGVGALVSAPVLVDLDGDGDLDLLAGRQDGRLVYYLNSGSATNPAFAASAPDPFGLADVGDWSAPAFADLDSDGDLDLIVGRLEVGLAYFENSGSATDPAFAALSSNPFGLGDLGYYSAPALADLDGDGDLDLFVGRPTGGLAYFRNSGQATDAAFAAPVANPFGMDSVEGFSAPAFADLDGEGDLDLLVGRSDGQLIYLRNTGSARPPAFAASSVNPFGLGGVGDRSGPTFGDLDGDGTLDVIVGVESGSLLYFDNLGSATAPAFASPSANPFGLADVGGSVAPAFADLDGDGDLDLLVGRSDGRLVYFRNDGSATDPAFAASSSNPFGLGDLGYYSAPAFGDLDGDGKLDLMVGNLEGHLVYFRNLGSKSSPAFTSSALHPFGLADVGANSAPTFADLDGDGDLDLLAGRGNGHLVYFKNTGSALIPAFASSAVNPFGLADVGDWSAPALADLDRDGDLDVMVGRVDGGLVFFPGGFHLYLPQLLRD